MIYLLFIVSSLINLTTSRLITREFQSVNLRQQKSWIYLDRMHCDVGQVKIQFWVYLRTDNVPSANKYKINLVAVPDYLWEQEIQRKCSGGGSQNQHDTQSYNKDEPKSKKQTITLTLNHQSALTNKSSLSINIIQPTTYYFVLTDCDRSMVNEYFNKKSRFDIQVDIKNNGSNYGHDQAMYTWMIPLMIGVCSVLIHKLNKNNSSNDYQDINWPIIIFKIIVWSHVVGLSFFYFGHVIYVLGRGKDIAFFSFVFLIVSTFSQAMMLILITFCAYGWMTTYKVSDNQEIYYPISTVAGFLSLVLALLSKINDGEPQKTHLYDSVPSFIQIILKSICLCVFLVGIVLSYTKFTKNGPFLSYIRKLAIFGIICFASVPFVMLCSSYMSKHTRWVSVFLLVQFLRTLQVAVIGYQILNKKSTYNKLTLHGKSFMEHDNKYL